MKITEIPIKDLDIKVGDIIKVKKTSKMYMILLTSNERYKWMDLEDCYASENSETSIQGILKYLGFKNEDLIVYKGKNMELIIK